MSRRRLRMAVRKLFTAGPRGWALLLRAQWAVLRSAAVVRRTPRGRLIADLDKTGPAEAPARPSDQDRVEAIGLAIDRVARLGFGQPLCLVRSLAYQRILVADEIPGSRIRVGVRMNGTAFEAHAWIEWNGRVVGEDPSYVARFRPFSTFAGQPASSTWPGRASSA